MPAIPPRQIVEAVLHAIEASGSHGLLVSGVRGHPRQFRILTEDGRITLWIYIWTITHGGRANLPDEYRIQMTTVVPPLRMNPTGPTLLLGWYPDLAVFAGFDISRHRNFQEGSNSVQVSLTALRAASNFSWVSIQTSLVKSQSHLDLPNFSITYATPKNYTAVGHAQ